MDLTNTNCNVGLQPDPLSKILCAPAAIQKSSILISFSNCMQVCPAFPIYYFNLSFVSCVSPVSFCDNNREIVISVMPALYHLYF